jgi:hypothetical protein
VSYDIFAPVVEAIAAKTSILKQSSMTTGSIDFLLVEVRLVRANQCTLINIDWAKYTWITK